MFFCGSFLCTQVFFFLFFLVCTCELRGLLLPLYLLHEDKKRLAIVLPLLRQLALMREFVTTHIHRQLKAVGVQIAEIIHTCQERETYL